MNILHLDSGREMRGGQRQLLLLLRGLDQHGVSGKLLARGALAASTGAQALSVAAVRREAHRADLIHAHDARSHTLAAVVAPRTPLIVSRRVAFPVRRGPLSRWKYTRADCFLAVSHYVARMLCEAGVAAERIRVVHDGVDMTTAAPLDPPPADRPIRAGILEIDDALKLGDLAREGCRSAGVEIFADRSLDAVLRNSGFLLYLTAEEGLGSALLAAAAAGRPAVASGVGGVSEVVAHEQTGLLVANEVAAVAAAARRFADDRRFLQACAVQAFERAANEFRSDIMVTRTLEAYRELLQS